MPPKVTKRSRPTPAEPASETHVSEKSAHVGSPFADGALLQVLEELESLLSQCRLAFLIGAGCSHCAGLPLMDGLTQHVQSKLTGDSAEILKAIQTNFTGTGRCTIEDYMSELVDLIALAERRKRRAAHVSAVPLGDSSYESVHLEMALRDIKREIAESIATRDCNRHIDTHRRFIRTIHGILRSGKGSAPATPVEYFTLNYDTLFEDAIAVERIHLADGFRGGATGWWDATLYDDPTVHARVYKLHGSIDWCLCDDDVLPRRIREGVEVPSRQDHILIWPAATKYREAQRDPYAQLVSLMRRALRPSTNAEVVLCVCGYAFADEHVNVEIDRALRESNERLTVVAFVSDNEPTGQLKQWRDDSHVSRRVRVYANRGYFHADDVRLSAIDLPWWKFEVLTELLTGHR